MVSRINRRAILSLFFSAFMVFGCVKTPNYLQDSTTKTIFFSTKDFKFYDLGFIKTYSTHTSLEIFNAGVVLLKMDCYSNKVCLNAKCYAKDSIVRQFFGNDALRELDFQALFKGDAIFNGENRQNLTNGFYQRIVRGELVLEYFSTKDSIQVLVQNTTTLKNLFTLEMH